MATDRTEMDELVEERPVPGALVRHRGASLTVHPVERAAPRLEVQRGALWIRATDAGPGVLLTHGAATVQVRDGAAVLEVSDFEALLVVVSGRAAVKGSAALPRSVTAGQAVTLTLDGGFGSPETLTPDELAADRFISENLARDALASVLPAAPPEGDEPAGAPPAELSPPATARLDHAPPSAPAAPMPAAAPPAPPAPVDDAAMAAPPPVDPEPAEAEPAKAAAAPAPRSYEQPPEVQVPGGTGGPPRDTTPDPPNRRGLLAVVIGLVVLAAVIGAVVLASDDSPSSGSVDTVRTTTPEATTAGATGPAPEATLRDCVYGDDGWVATGTVEGGGQAVARYEVVIGVQEPDGTVYAEKAERVVPAEDRAEAVAWTATLTVPLEDVVPDSECLLLRVEALRVQPR